MIRILLACEGGAGLGHVTNLRAIALALGDAFIFEGVHYQDETLTVLEPVCDAVFRGPGMSIRRRAKPRGPYEQHWTWASFLESCQFNNSLLIAQKLFWWRTTLLLRKIDLLVADYAPFAILAARTLDIPCVVAGTAYGVPPDSLARFPSLMQRDAATFVNEQRMVDAINAAIVIRGSAPLKHLPDMYACAAKLPRGLGFLDPYNGIRTGPLLPTTSGFSVELAGSGDELFVYLSHIHDDPPYMLESLHLLDVPVRVFAPWLDEARAEKLREQGIAVEDKPVSPDDIARRSRLMVHYGQPATTAMALAAGLPQLALPQHIEQLVHATLSQAQGGVRLIKREGLTAESYLEAIRSAMNDQALFKAAQAIAPAVRREMSIDVKKMIQETLRPVLVDIIRKKGLA